MSILLQDSDGSIWSVAPADDGTLVSSGPSSGTAVPVIVNDYLGSSWQLGIGLGGAPITITQVPSVTASTTIPVGSTTSGTWYLSVVLNKLQINLVSSTTSSASGTALTAYEIPLQSGPQIFNISLANVNYQITVKWNNNCQSWVIDIADSNGNPILSGIPLVTGVNLLGQFGYLNFGGQLVAQTENDPSAVPTFTNLGTQGNLYFFLESNG